MKTCTRNHGPLFLQENPWREYKAVQEVFSETQKEADERAFLAGRWWMPYHLGREKWCVLAALLLASPPPSRSVPQLLFLSCILCLFKVARSLYPCLQARVQHKRRVVLEVKSCGAGSEPKRSGRTHKKIVGSCTVPFSRFLCLAVRACCCRHCLRNGLPHISICWHSQQPATRTIVVVELRRPQHAVITQRSAAVRHVNASELQGY
jgi:hypothetical protein